MARQKALSEEERAAAQARLVRHWDPTKREPSMRDMERAVGDALSKIGKTGPTGEALRKLQKHGEAGLSVIEALEVFFGESRSKWLADMKASQADRTVEREERYPTVARAFADARAVGISEAVLDIVRGELGAHEGAGPTDREVHEKIREVSRRHAKLRAFYSGDQNISELDEAPKLRRK